MVHMMDNPVTAMMLLVGLIVLLAALTIGLRVLGGRDGRHRPRTPATSTAAPMLEAATPPTRARSLEQ